MVGIGLVQEAFMGSSDGGYKSHFTGNIKEFGLQFSPKSHGKSFAIFK